MIRPGDRLKGRYRIIRELGTGGHGSVFEARDLISGASVAVKVLRRELAADKDYVRRFRREAEIARMLESRHVVRLIEFGHGQVSGGEVEFQISEFCSGQTLHDVLLHHRPLRAVDALSLAIQVARALEEAESKGVVHRDVKPRNIFLEADGTLKLGDFGIATATEFPSLRADDPIVGTPKYMAPEQLSGSGVTDIRGDIYSLGVVLYEMLNGTPPFAADNPRSVAYLQVNQEPAPISGDKVGRIWPLVRRCLAKNPDDRFQSARAVREELDQAMAAEREVTGPPALDRLVRWSRIRPGRNPREVAVGVAFSLANLVKRRTLLATTVLLAVVLGSTLLAAVAATALSGDNSSSDSVADFESTTTPRITQRPTPTHAESPSPARIPVSVVQPPCPEPSTDQVPGTPTILAPLSEEEITGSRPVFCWQYSGTENCFRVQLADSPPDENGDFRWWYEGTVYQQSEPIREAWRFEWAYPIYGQRGTQPPERENGPASLENGRYYWRLSSGCTPEASALSEVHSFTVRDPVADLLADEILNRKATNLLLEDINRFDVDDVTYAVLTFGAYMPLDQAVAENPNRQTWDRVEPLYVTAFNKPADVVIYAFPEGIPVEVYRFVNGETGVEPDMIDVVEPSGDDINGDGSIDIVLQFSIMVNCCDQAWIKVLSLEDGRVTALPIILPDTGILGIDVNQDGSSVAPATIEDVDGDGIYEVIAYDSSWVYNGFCHACSPGSSFVLGWEKDRGAWLDRSAAFPQHYQETLDATNQRIEDLAGQTSVGFGGACSRDEGYLSEIISLSLVYARLGRSEMAWQRFNELTTPDKFLTEDWRNIVGLVRRDLELAVPSDGSAPLDSIVPEGLPVIVCGGSTPTPSPTTSAQALPPSVISPTL